MKDIYELNIGRREIFYDCKKCFPTGRAAEMQMRKTYRTTYRNTYRTVYRPQSINLALMLQSHVQPRNNSVITRGSETGGDDRIFRSRETTVTTKNSDNSLLGVTVSIARK